MTPEKQLFTIILNWFLLLLFVGFILKYLLPKIIDVIKLLIKSEQARKRWYSNRKLIGILLLTMAAITALILLILLMKIKIIK
jgi:hypothetical protein